MAKKKLYAKDKRKLARRRGASLGLLIGGGAALALVAWYLYRKIIVDATPAPGVKKDWSGCLTPPDWVQPRPKFSCGQRVTSRTLYNVYGEGPEGTIPGEDSVITQRTWSSGQWVYDLLSSNDPFDESDLTEA